MTGHAQEFVAARLFRIGKHKAPTICCEQLFMGFCAHRGGALAVPVAVDSLRRWLPLAALTIAESDTAAD